MKIHLSSVPRAHRFPPKSWHIVWCHTAFSSVGDCEVNARLLEHDLGSSAICTVLVAPVSFLIVFSNAVALSCGDKLQQHFIEKHTVKHTLNTCASWLRNEQCHTTARTTNELRKFDSVRRQEVLASIFRCLVLCPRELLHTQWMRATACRRLLAQQSGWSIELLKVRSGRAGSMD